MLALTATTWRSASDTDDHFADVTTLWGMAPEGWQATGTVIGVAVVAIGTIAVFLADTAGRTTHVVFVVLCLLTVAGIILRAAPPTWKSAAQLR